MNNSNEIKSKDTERKPIRFTDRAKRIVGALAVAGISVGAVELSGVNDKAEFRGEQTIRIDGNYPTVTDISNEVGGVNNGHANDTIDEIVKLNPDVFQDRGPGTTRAYVESQDVGEEITIPVHVK